MKMLFDEWVKSETRQQWTSLGDEPGRGSATVINLEHVIFRFGQYIIRGEALAKLLDMPSDSAPAAQA